MPETEKKHLIEFDKTINHTMEGCSFDILPIETVNEIFKDGRVFSHFMERWLEELFGLKHVKGCKDHDLVDPTNHEIKYEVKTFTKGGCRFCSSNMVGVGRKFNQEVFEEKTKKLLFCIVSNIDFPNIKIRFVKGVDLLEYKTGKIPSKDFVKFFD